MSDTTKCCSCGSEGVPLRIFDYAPPSMYYSQPATPHAICGLCERIPFGHDYRWNNSDAAKSARFTAYCTNEVLKRLPAPSPSAPGGA